jgi:hypothetical protein
MLGCELLLGAEDSEGTDDGADDSEGWDDGADDTDGANDTEGAGDTVALEDLEEYDLIDFAPVFLYPAPTRSIIWLGCRILF